MAAPPRRSTREAFSKVELAVSIVGAVLGGAVLYWLIGLLHNVDALEGSTAVTWAQRIVSGLAAAGALVGNILEARDRARAQQVIENVDKELERRKKTEDMANVSAEALKASLPKTNLKDDQVATLVEQRRQRFLIDDEYFRKELSHLIVDYLQPLPRNAKRVVNRFRVDLLIADDRGLLKGDSRAMAQLIGKWLVLSERWPQLGRALSAAPDKMGELESQATRAAVALAAAPAPVPAAPAPAAPAPDPFTETLKTLAPFYAGDEDLRRFMQSPPALAAVLPSLVNFVVEERAS